MDNKRFVRMKEITEKTGLSKWMLEQIAKESNAKIQLAPKCVVFDLDLIMQCIESKRTISQV